MLVAIWNQRNVAGGWLAGVLFHHNVPQVGKPPESPTGDVYFPAARYAAPSVHVSPRREPVPEIPP